MAKSNLLRGFKQSSGLSNEGLAALVSERTGRELTAVQVEGMMGRPQAPKYVLEALDLEPETDAGGVPLDPPPASVFPPDWPLDEPPNEPRDARTPSTDLEPSSPFDFDVAETRMLLVEAYKVAGKGAAYVGKNDAYERAFDLHAERCADAWIGLARRNARVARVLQSLTSGGAVGQLLLIHLSLVMSMLVAAGKIELPDGVVPSTPSHDANGAVNGNRAGETAQPATA